MDIDALQENARSLAQELHWFGNVLNARIAHYFRQVENPPDIASIEPPDLTNSDSPYAQLVKEFSMSREERLVLVLALVPHVKPNLLDIFFTKNENFNRGYTEFGGINGNFHSGFIPTGETVSFILAGEDLEQRFRLRKLFQESHFFYRHNLLKLEGGQPNKGEPALSNVLRITDEALSMLTEGVVYKPDYSTNFPAKRIKTRLKWDDLVLDDHVREELDDILTWMEHGKDMMENWGLSTRVKQGYRALFHGPPGTGKTLTACLIGQSLDIDVYRIDLSMIISKYIGETEKNLANVFDQAANKRWVLFFDEADALFGKRTATQSSNDRHANQEVAYLLQRIEDFPGIIILASNLKGNLDEAFTRRFQSIVYFPMPNEDQRLQLWQKAFSDNLEFDPAIDLDRIAREHALAGGSIANVLRHCAIKAKQRGTKQVLVRDLESGIRKEFMKEGKG